MNYPNEKTIISAIENGRKASELDYIPYGNEPYTMEQAEYIDGYDAVKAELNYKLMLSRKYGYDEYADELAGLLEKLDMYRRGGR